MNATTRKENDFYLDNPTHWGAKENDMTSKEMIIVQALWDEYVGFCRQLDEEIADEDVYCDLGSLTEDTPGMKVLRKDLRSIGIKIVGKN